MCIPIGKTKSLRAMVSTILKNQSSSSRKGSRKSRDSSKLPSKTKIPSRKNFQLKRGSTEKIKRSKRIRNDCLFK
jgi:hypothetical protein